MRRCRRQRQPFDNMPYPIALAAGAALSAAGTGMQMAAAKQSERAMNKSVASEVKRQRGYRDEAMQAYQRSLAESGRETAERDIGAGEAARAAAYQRLQEIPLAAPSNTQAPVETTSPGRSGAAKEQNMAKQQAAYMGLSEWQLRQLIKNMRAQQHLGMISTIARDSAGVNPFEVQQARHAGDTLAGIGGITSAAGSMLGAYGAMP